MAWLTSLVVGCQKTCLAALAPINPFKSTQSWSIPPIFGGYQSGSVSSSVMFNTFNMGIGLLLVPPNQAEQTISWFESQDIDAYDRYGDYWFR